MIPYTLGLQVARTRALCLRIGVQRNVEAEGRSVANRCSRWRSVKVALVHESLALCPR
jgi:hypothetical protein